MVSDIQALYRAESTAENKLKNILVRSNCLVLYEYDSSVLILFINIAP